VKPLAEAVGELAGKAGGKGRRGAGFRALQHSAACSPAAGYTKMFERLLDHPNIVVRTGVEYRNIVATCDVRRTVFTGPIDEYYDHRFGRLPYRSLRFDAYMFAMRPPIAPRPTKPSVVISAEGASCVLASDVLACVYFARLAFGCASPCYCCGHPAGLGLRPR